MGHPLRVRPRSHQRPPNPPPQVRLLAHPPNPPRQVRLLAHLQMRQHFLSAKPSFLALSQTSRSSEGPDRDHPVRLTASVYILYQSLCSPRKRVKVEERSATTHIYM